MKKLILSTSSLLLLLAVTNAQRTNNSNTQPEAIKPISQQVSIVKPANDLIDLISATEPTELTGSFSFIDPATNEKHLPPGKPSIRLKWFSLVDASWSYIDYPIYPEGFFTPVNNGYEYKVLVRPDLEYGASNPAVGGGKVTYNPTKWKLESLQMVWTLWEPLQYVNSKYDPTLFLDKIQVEFVAHHNQKYYYFPLKKVN